jgi:hypothetical protein
MRPRIPIESGECRPRPVFLVILSLTNVVGHYLPNRLCVLTALIVGERLRSQRRCSAATSHVANEKSPSGELAVRAVGAECGVYRG